MNNRTITNDELCSLEKSGIDLFSNTLINYKFSVTVGSSRLNFFEMFFKKMLNDSFYVSDKKGSIKCDYDIISNTFTVCKTHFLCDIGFTKLLKGPDISYDDILVESVSYKKITLNFNYCHPLVIAKHIIDIKDCVSFINSLYGYDEDGSEILLVRFRIGSIVNIGIDIYEYGCDPIDYVIVGYEFERDSNGGLICDIREVDENGNFLSKTIIEESKLIPSRGNNLNILLN